MKELVSVIILLSIIKLTSYGSFNYKKKNILGTVGTFILIVGMIFMLSSVFLDF